MMEKLAPKAQLEIDGEIVSIANARGKKTFTSDGAHTVKVSSPKMGNSRSVTVKGGATEEITLPLLPGH